jgi:ABC-2 type transport system ATP-binding protein
MNLASTSAPRGVVVRDLRIDYGLRTAVYDLSMTVEPGEIFGLLGPNGAGKTSVFRVLATLQEPVYGEVSLGGCDARRDPESVRALLAYMPDLAPLPHDLRAEEYLRFFAQCHGLYGKACTSRVEECLAAVELTDRRRDWCRQLSLGMRQRLVLARSLLHRPGVLVLDEPASGMDAPARASLRRALKQQAAAGTTIILSSHVLSEIQELCTSIGLIREGRLVDSGPLRDVLQRQNRRPRRLRLRTSGAPQTLIAWLSGHGGATARPAHIVDGEVEYEFAGDASAQAELFAKLGAAGLGVYAMREQAVSVEDVVLGLHDAPPPLPLS